MFISSLVACGGGGGGTSYPDLSYTGVQTQAVIDPANADDFATVMLNSNGSTSIPLLGGATLDTPSNEGLPDSESVNRLSSFATDLLTNKLSGNAAVLVTGASETLNGNCGGSMTIAGDDTGTTINATVTMNSFCESDGLGGTFTMHGRMTLNASYTGTSNNPSFTSMSINIEYIKLTYNDGVTTQSEEFSGSLYATYTNGIPDSFVLTVNFRYEGQIYRIADFNVDETAGTIAATLYHPDHGYVVITTTNAFTYDAFNEQFCDGTLQITGSNGVVEFTASPGCSTYDICLTIDPDPQVCSLGNQWGTEPVWP